MIIREAVHILFPSFIYNYRSLLPGDSYIKEVVMELREQGIEPIVEGANHVAFYVHARKVLGFFGVGKFLIEVERSLEEGYLFKVQFVTLKAIFYIIAVALSVLIVFRVAFIGELIGLMIIPIVFMFGHVLFLGILPSKVKRLKIFLLHMNKKIKV